MNQRATPPSMSRRDRPRSNFAPAATEEITVRAGRGSARRQYQCHRGSSAVAQRQLLFTWPGFWGGRWGGPSGAEKSQQLHGKLPWLSHTTPSPSCWLPEPTHWNVSHLEASPVAARHAASASVPV